jgi:hypothetical protein
MKNIHLIPTENYKQDYTLQSGEVVKVVRLGQLILNKETNELSVNKNPHWAASCDTDVLVPHHIYITSDEEIKKDDWFLDIISNTIHQAKQGTGVFNTRKKIILTTDQYLIANGVQPIDDEFLEWFVGNPSCESVEVIYSSLMKDYEYELLFPKEEPKSHIEYTNTDDCTSMIYNQQEKEQLPTKWFKTEQIETWIGESITTEGKEIKEIKGGRGKLIVMHQCGENKEELISQLETMIYGLKEGFEYFVGN